MEPKEIVDYWIARAEHDWHTAQSLFEKEEFPSSLFFGHLHLEKLLKALVVQHTQTHAPYGRALGVLARKSELALTPDQEMFLDRVTEYNIQARYPD